LKDFEDLGDNLNCSIRTDKEIIVGCLINLIDNGPRAGVTGESINWRRFSANFLKIILPNMPQIFKMGEWEIPFQKIRRKGNGKN